MGQSIGKLLRFPEVILRADSQVFPKFRRQLRPNDST